MSNYINLSLKNLEESAKTFREQSRDNQKAMYEILEHIRRYNRFREDPRYKKSSFWDYLEDQFLIRKATFEDNVRAYTKYPEETKEFGPGLVNKIIKECGGISKAKHVFTHLKTASDSHKNTLSRATIQKIIAGFQNPNVGVIKKEITDWRLMYETEKSAHEKTKVDLIEAEALIAKQEQRIHKLKGTLNRWKSAVLVD